MVWNCVEERNGSVEQFGRVQRRIVFDNVLSTNSNTEQIKVNKRHNYNMYNIDHANFGVSSFHGVPDFCVFYSPLFHIVTMYGNNSDI